MDSNPKFVICNVKNFHPPCAEVCVGYSFPLELTTYNVSTKSNILVKYNKAKINFKILVLRIWHKVHTTTNHNLFDQTFWSKKTQNDICQLDQLIIVNKSILTCLIWLNIFGWIFLLGFFFGFLYSSNEIRQWENLWFFSKIDVKKIIIYLPTYIPLNN
jgi:hypothetical protein